MRLKRFLLVLLISLMCLSVPSFVFAVTDTESRVQEKLEAGLEVSNKSLTDRITTEEIAEIEAKYQTYLKQEEKYEIQIAESLRSSTGNEEMYNLVLSTEKEDKISAMKEMILFIKESPSIKEEHRNQFNSYISKYAPYVDEQFIREYYNTISVKSVQEYRKASNFNTLNNWSYNSTNAVNYALNNYNNYNSSYPNVTALGGDCANFVSQSLYAGGIPMNGSWYVYKKNSTYPSPQTVAELDHSWTLASPSPWISAKEFNAKWYPIFFLMKPSLVPMYMIIKVLFTISLTTKVM